MNRTVLVADDEEKIAKMVGTYLEANGFRAVLAHDGERALSLFRELGPDLCILDINMPGLDGLEVAREIRRTSSVPIILLSARTDETDRVVGLELGADDYVPKPFSPRELVARARAVLRRSGPATAALGTAASGAAGARTAAPTRLRRGTLELDILKRSVAVGGVPVRLTAVQFDILLFLAREPGRVFTRAEILEASSGTTFEGYERTVDAHIKNIRKALGGEGPEGESAFLGTIRGVGYRFIELPDEA
jgi:DNA-binding response OmpR family regulator